MGVWNTFRRVHTRLALITVLIYGGLLTGLQPAQAQQESAPHTQMHSVATELRNLSDVSTLPVYRTGTAIQQVSSYDTTGGNNDGFSGQYSYLRKTTAGDLVIFDARGAGVINRIWTPTPTDDTLDFYLDDMETPAFSICFQDLFSGKQYPFIAPLCGNELGGYYCYLPIPFQQRAKIVFRGERLMFYQIQWRSYPEGAKVEPFQLAFDNTEKAALARVTTLWQKENPGIEDFQGLSASTKVVTRSIVIDPGSTQDIFSHQTGGRIIGMVLEPLGQLAGPNQQLDLSIWWDGEKNPAVDCPVTDFFGFAFGQPAMQSLLLGSRDHRGYCYFPMPFDQQARIALHYRKGDFPQQPIELQARIYYRDAPRDPKTEGKFYTHWVSRSYGKDSGPHVFLDVNGKGHYVGTIQQAQGLEPGMTLFFEGDDSTAVDGQFRMHGTGSEDYYNGGWYALLDRWDTGISLPLHGALTYSLPLARTGGYRFFLSDKLPFAHHFFQSIEHGPTDRVPVHYTSLAFYYADRPAEKFMQPTNELTRVFQPDTLMMYPQLMQFSIRGHVDLHFDGPLVLTGEDGALVRIDVRALPKGDYTLYMDYNEDQNGAKVSVWQRQDQLTDWISTYRPERKHIPRRQLCTVKIRDFKNTLSLRFRSDQEHKSLSLNRLIFVRQTKP